MDLLIYTRTLEFKYVFIKDSHGVHCAIEPRAFAPFLVLVATRIYRLCIDISIVLPSTDQIVNWSFDNIIIQHATLMDVSSFFSLSLVIYIRDDESLSLVINVDFLA